MNARLDPLAKTQHCKAPPAPRNPTEKKLVAIWAEVFQSGEPGIFDDFLALGGHSMLAIRILTRVEATFGVLLTLAQVFNAPSVAALSEEIKAAKERGKASTRIPLTPQPRTERLPFSFPQQRLWFTDQLAPGSAIYNVPMKLEFKGPLNPEHLTAALNAFVNRHEILRTHFIQAGDEHYQIVEPPGKESLVENEYIDLSKMQEEARQAEFARLQQENKPFDLTSELPIRAKTCNLGGDTHCLLLTVHHIASDDWSIRLLLKELGQFYCEFNANVPNTLPDLPVQYGDFAAWQRQTQSDEELKKQLAYWQQQLASLPNLDLPTDRPRPPLKSYRGGTEKFTLTQDLSLNLRHLGQQHGSTLFMTLSSAFQVLLGRYSGQTDVALSTLIDSRNHIDLEKLVGFFSNAIILRSNLSGPINFTQFLERNRQTCLEAYENRRLPFEQLVEAIQPHRDPSRHPLSQVSFVLNATLGETGSIGADLKTRFTFTESKHAKMDLSLEMAEDGDGFMGYFEYNTDLFDAISITRMRDHFETLLKAIVAEPDSDISQLPMINEAERRHLLHDWNATETPCQPQTLHALFETQAARTPDAVALVSGETRIPYQELEDRANAVACWLQDLGADAEHRVGVLLPRTEKLVIALLGILKSGSAYIPLDYSYPAERVRYMLTDSKASLLLTEKDFVGALPEHIHILREDEIPAESDGRLPQTQADENNLAYLIYTSGSTGFPKGVAIPHNNASAMISWAHGVFSNEELQGVLAATSICFDLSVYEIFLPLSVGGKVILAENALALRDLPAVDEVTLVNTVPSALLELVREAPLPSSITTVNLAGETLKQSLVDLAYHSLSVKAVYNLYGPSEDTTYSTFAHIERGSDAQPTIGRPVANTRTYLLDDHLELVPIRITGELYLAGTGLARGYEGQPAVTARQFIPNPFSHRPGSRMYRTGDMARYRNDGRLDYLGRVDNQIKLRGFRIEIGEIEATLTARDEIREAAVVVNKTENLVALIAWKDHPLPIHDLNELLALSLPHYMIPSQYVALDALPKTANGKVDRTALPSLLLLETIFTEESDGTVDLPRDPAEELLAVLWSKLFGLEQVGIHKNFFELGGHSLMATRLLSRIRRIFSVDLPMVSIFNAPTIAKLALEIERVFAQARERDAPAMIPLSRSGKLPLSFAQQRLWFLDRLQPGSALYNIPLQLEIKGPLERFSLRLALIELVERHEVLRTDFTMVGEEPRPLIRDVFSLPLLGDEPVDLSGVSPETREQKKIRYLQEEATKPFDLAEDALIRFRLIHLQENHHLLLVTAHHIVFDSWSTGLFLEELTTLYRDFCKGSVASLRALPVQYADYASWQREWLEGDVLDQQLDYWKNQLAGLPNLALPTDKPRPPIMSYRCAQTPVSLPAHLEQALRRLGQAQGTTLFMTVLSAFQSLLSRYSGQDDLAVASPIANRRHVEAEDLIGFFVNTLILRARLAEDTTFTNLLKANRATCLEAYENQDLPFEQLVQELSPERDLSRNPLVQASLVLQNSPDPVQHLAPGVEMTFTYGGGGFSEYDLQLDLVESLGCLQGTLGFSTDLFDHKTVAGIWSSFLNLLEGVVAEPDRLLDEIPLLSPSQQALVLSICNRTDYPRDQTLAEVFETQVAQNPDAIAFVYDNTCLSYAQLDREANMLAMHLIELGAAPGDMNAVCLERSPELLIAALGILKAGGAYVPLDPSFPKDRQVFYMDDVGAKLLLTDAQQGKELANAGARIVDMQAAVYHKNQAKTLPPNRRQATDPAIVYFTSGSTGRPKGVLLPHRAIMRLVVNTNFHQMQSDDRVGQVNSVSFDITSWEIWGSLLNAATLIICSREVVLSPTRFITEVRAKQVTVMMPTTALFNHTTRETPDAFNSLRVCMFGGERADPERVRAVQATGGPILRNVYGPTENATLATWHEIGPVTENTDSIPIGKAVANTRSIIVDRLGNPVPQGVPGELVTTGDGLALGYLNRPDLTAEKFPTGLAGEPNTRWYRTGDLCRYLKDDVIDYVGRFDDQVKIHGYRIEPGEIQATIETHPLITGSLVVIRKNESGEKYLSAFILTMEDEGESTALLPELRTFLAEQLPPYMRPKALTIVGSFPMTANGKIDFVALSELEALQPDEEDLETFIEPSTPLEMNLAQIWQTLLAVEKIGLASNFFTLGGHSLMATRLYARLGTQFGFEPPLAMLFNTPTLGPFCARFEAFLNEQEGGHLILASMERGQGPICGGETTVNTRPIASQPRDQSLPLSFAQLRLWFIDRLEPNSIAYNIPMILDLKGPLNKNSLVAALSRLVQRHEALRTVFKVVGGEPEQIILPDLDPPLLSGDTVDLSHMEASARLAEQQRIEQEEAQRLFDLTNGPLLRGQLLRCEQHHHRLLLTFHHIIFDGWSSHIFCRELESSYAECDQALPSSLAPLPIQYADYALWQRQWLRDEVLERQMLYWREQLADLAVLELPTDRPRPKTMSYAGANLPVSLPFALCQELRELGYQHGATLFMTLHSALAELLGRYARQQDLAIASPIANRKHLALEGLIGFFVNTLVLRADLQESSTFAEFLKRTRKTTLAAYENQDLPFEQLVELLDLERSQAHNPLAQVLFALQNTPQQESAASELEMTLSYSELDIARFDLTLILEETSGGLSGNIEYSTALFDRTSIQSMWQCFQTLLAGIVAAPDQVLGEIPMLTADQRAHLLAFSSQSNYPRDSTLFQLFEAQAERDPQATAYIFGETETTYAELNRQANLLAARLLLLGAGPGKMIAICLDRSPELVLSTLAILKTGAAYVPLDPSYPGERQALYLEEIEAEWVLTSGKKDQPFGESDAQIVDLDDMSYPDEDCGNPTCSVRATDPCLVYFTSGSTGRPKGVLLPHRAVVRLVVNTNYCELAPDDRIGQCNSVSFDIASWEIWGSLLNGATLVIFSREVVLSPSRFIEEIRAQKITVMMPTTALFNHTTRNNPDAFNTLRVCMFGGERADPERVRAVQAAGGPILRNVYGPTENATLVTWHEIEPVTENTDSIPIGKAVANTRAVIVDPKGNPVPLGCPGELIATGDGLAMGYLNRPELTAEKFPSGLAGEPETRWYRTGDLCVYLPGFVIDYRGRIDNQVKIHGYRIEPGEIQACIETHTLVTGSLVVIRYTDSGDKYLAAYVLTQHEDWSALSQELHELFAEQLPPYMRPKALVLMEAHPITANGKIDFNALAVMEAEQTAQQENEVFLEPQTPLQKQLAAIWKTLLSVDRVGLDDSFFILGGHSLMATRLYARLVTQFGFEPPLAMLFNEPQLGAFAERFHYFLTQQKGAGQVLASLENAELLIEAGEAITKTARDQPLPLSFAQQRLWFIDRLESGSHAYNIPIVLALHGPLDLAALAAALNGLVDRHEVLRTVFRMSGLDPRQVILPALDPPLLAAEPIDLSTLDEQARDLEVARLEREEAHKPFHLATDEVIRAQLLRLSEQSHRLQVNIHHVAFDGWSCAVFFRELETLYTDFSAGQPSSLPPLPIQYADYTVWQRQWLSGNVLQRQVDYWRQQLTGLAVLELPTDRPRPRIISYAGAMEPVGLPRNLCESLRELGQDAGATLFMTLLGAFSELMGRYARQHDFAIASPIANRKHQALEGLIGFFVNTLVLRADMTGNPSFSDLLERTRQTTLAAYEHQDLPFEQLVEALDPERSQAHNPLAQVLFALQNQLEKPDTSDSDLRMDLSLSNLDIAKFDLTLDLEETGEGLVGNMEYSTDLFDRTSIQSMWQCFQTLLAGIVADPKRPLGEISLLNQAQKEQLLAEHNATDYPRDQTLNQLFEAQVAQNPNQIAYVWGKTRVSYAEFNREANLLAGHLLQLGAGPGQMIGICLERCPDLLTSAMAILKTGAAYVPLDPAFPSERQVLYLEEISALLVLTNKAKDRELGGTDAHVIDLDNPIWRQSGNETNPENKAAATDTGLIYFTSGSTGRPKGVLVPHRAVVRLVINTNYFKMRREDRVAMVNSVSFDVVSWEIWGSLLNGATLVIFSREIVLSPSRFHQEIRDKKITTMMPTTALFNHTSRETPDAFNPLRECMFAGERADADCIRAVQAAGGPILRNAYGPTENGTLTTCHEIARIDENTDDIPIGVSLSNTRTLIVDPNSNPVPPGMPGELVTTGDGLAKGYLNRPDLTAEKFPTGLIKDEPETRWYRTGDLCRYQHDGVIRYVGRIDQQIKIHGYRVEPGEIQAIIESHERVTSSLVTVRYSASGNKYLAAYLLSQKEDQAVLLSEVRSLLKEQLPVYMRPKTLAIMQSFPISANGKVDFAALARLESDQAHPDHDSFVEPQTPLERILADIWRSLLDVDRVGAHDDFFELGGHSLMATRFYANLVAKLRFEPPLAMLFNDPTLSGFATRFQDYLMRQDGGEQLLFALENGESPDLGNRAPTTIPRIDRRGQLPLSYAQRRLWFIDRLDPGSHAYNIPMVLDLKGDLDRTALATALNSLVDRHEILRTVFAMSGQEPEQIILDCLETPLLAEETIDLANLEEQKADILKRLSNDEARRPFDLKTGPLIRARLIYLGNHQHRLLLTIHHIVFDGWSTDVFLNELKSSYADLIAGKTSCLPDLPVQYADFSVAQQHWLSDEAQDRQQAYWRQQLDDLPVLQLPTDRPRPQYMSRTGAIFLAPLPSPLGQALRDLGQRHGATLFMTLLSAFESLMGRYAGQQDLAVASPIANRKNVAVQNMIGFFVNTLILRADLSGNPSFVELLARTRQTTLDAFEHQDLPFEQLVEMLDLERSRSREPLAQVVFTLHKQPRTNEFFAPGLEMTLSDGDLGLAKSDLAMTFIESADGLLGEIEYYTELFDRDRITSMWQSFHTFLDGIVAEPDRALEEICLLNPEQKQQLLAITNDTDYPRDQTVCVLFEAQADATPDSIAFTYNDMSTSYEQLNREANALAAHLIELGAEPGDMIPICLERSPELLISVLAILKTGAAYVPLDPSYPGDRLTFYLLEVGARRVLTTRTQDLGETSAQRIDLGCKTEPCKGAQNNPPCRVGATDPAVIFFTSGSTGNPKGVILPHRALVRLVINTNCDQVVRDDRTSMINSVSFDISSWEIWGPLLNGATLVIFSREVVLSNDRFTQEIRAKKLTTMDVPTALFNHTARVSPTAFNTLLTCSTGGERMDPECIRAIQATGGPILRNLYGPTENTTTTTWYEIGPVSKETESIPIGRSVSNCRVILVDAFDNPVPVGVPGELLASGDGLANGYLNRPELSRKMFPTGLLGEPETRWYRTGDLCRYLPDGAIDYVGRIDDQVKIHGYRVEPGEIQACIETHPRINGSQVTVRQTESGDKYLAAYILTREDEGTILAELRDILKERLPSYMRPKVIVPMTSFPLKANGKINFETLALMEADADSFTQADAFVEPKRPLEKMIADIWQSLLSVDRVGLDDSFFELGGHSLMATRLYARLNQQFDCEPPLNMLFDAPKLKAFAERFHDYLANQEDGQLILATLASGASFEKPNDSGQIQPCERTRPLPLSFSQGRLWFIDRLEPGTNTYNIPMVLQLQGPLDQSALAASLDLLVDRHEALRTIFCMSGQEPEQVVQPSHSPLLSRQPIDLSSLDKNERVETALEMELEEANKPFDLSEGPLIRCQLIHLDKNHHRLQVTIHHIAFDGWSTEIFIRELQTSYADIINQRPSSLPPLPIQYADFSVWQRQSLDGETLQGQLDYWSHQLADLPVLELPTDRPRPKVMSHIGASHPVNLPQPLSAALQQLSRERETTLFMTLISAFSELMGRYSRQQDFAIASPIANRKHLALEGLIGFFVNTLVLRTDLTGNPSFSELLTRTRETTLDAYKHQDLPFEQLVEILDPARSRAHAPLAQVVFSMVEMAQEEHASRSELQMTLSFSDLKVAKRDLGLELAYTPEGLMGEIEFSTDLFDQSTVVAMWQSFENLLTQIVAEPDRALGEISLLTQDQRRQLLAVTHETEYPRQLTLHQLFEAQVDKHPDDIAYEFEGTQTSYRDLNRDANLLAAHLIKQGVVPGQMIAVCQDRSPELLTGQLAILKTGAAYVPLDPSYPAGRQALYLEEIEAELVLTTRAHRQQLRTTHARIVFIGEGDYLESGAEANPSNPVHATDLAVVYFTSGSTGRPKGVLVPHRAVVRLVMNTNYLQIVREDRLAQINSISFDIASWEIWGTLLNGATLVVFPREAVLLQARFLKEIRDLNITVIHPTAALFNHTVRTHPDAFNTTRVCMSGGERAEPEGIRAVQASGGPTLINIYGPTENGTMTTWLEIGPVGENPGPIPIGTPVANTRAIIVDRHGNPVPPSVPGELITTGDGLATGYLNRPELTEEKFPIGLVRDEPETRWYRTGDLCRYLTNGLIDMVGRIDNQVKIHGYRIEPGEIESCIESHPEVTSSLVVIRNTESGDKYLAAYVLARDAASATLELTALRTLYSEQLPPFMRPKVTVILDSFPMTTNGKVDMDALAILEASHSSLHEPDSHVEPSTAMEKQLASIWQLLLSVDRVGAKDNFFELGGHSLMATRFYARIAQLFHTDPPLAMLFDEPTLGAFAKNFQNFLASQHGGPQLLSALENGEDLSLADSRPQNTFVLKTVDRNQAQPLSFAQQRLWFIDLLEPGSHTYNIPMVWDLFGPLDRSALTIALNDLVDRHEVLRTIFRMAGQEPEQVVFPCLDTPLLAEEPVDLSGLEEQNKTTNLARLSLQEAQRPFDLTTGPLIRGRLLYLGMNKHRLLLTIHHIVFDGWSTEILLRELQTRYADILSGTPSSLPDLPIQYIDFSVAQRQWLSGAVRERQQDYWRHQLADLQVLQLPTDRPRPRHMNHSGAFFSATLPLLLSQALRELGQRHGATLFMTLLSAFEELLGRYAGQQDLAVASPIANRRQLDVQNLIGFFVNTLVLRADLTENPSFVQLLKRTQKTTLAAYEHQDLPFEQLVEMLDPERNRAQNPLAQVMFTLQDTRPQQTSFAPGLQVHFCDDDMPVAKFDLSMGFMETPQGLFGEIVYRTDLFDRQRIIGIWNSFQTLLTGIIAEPDQVLGKISLLSPTQKEHLLANANRSDYPRDRTLNQLFEDQVEKSPQATAAVFNNRPMTYEELNRDANLLAAHLLQLGARPGQMIAISLERSPELLFSALAILKTGAAYVPLDPSFPGERQALYLEEISAPMVLTRHAQEHQFGETDARVLDLDGVGWRQGGAAINPTCQATASDPALVYFTSGSTGRPKGVLLPHRAISRLVLNTNYHQMAADDRVGMINSVSFDIASWEIWGCLLNGATLIIFPRDVVLSPTRFIEEVRAQKITVMMPTTALFNHTTREAPDAFNSLRVCMFGGERADPERVRAVQTAGGPILRNVYGPTENGTLATWHEIGLLSPNADHIPIGKAVSNTRSIIVDPHGNPVPMGVLGELVTSGDGLALGYLNRPELTAEKFPTGLAGETSTRWYRTGDLCRYEAGGAINYVGRIDHQIKIHGYRVEPGEIQAIIETHPEINGSLVVVRYSESGDKYLAAYLLSQQEDQTALASEVRGLLKEQLPVYMRPKALVITAVFPISTNGKIDFTALAKLESDLVPQPEDNTVVEPESPMERMLASIWQSLLEVERVGAHDDFFELGGHSLMATRLLARLGDTFGFEPPLAMIFDTKDLREFAAHYQEFIRGQEGGEEIIDYLEELCEMSEQEAQAMLDE